MKEKEFIRWSKYRKIGQLNFILLGGLYFVVLVNLVIFIGDTIRGKYTFHTESFIVGCLISALMGLFSGAMIWKRFEVDYKEHLDKKSRTV